MRIWILAFAAGICVLLWLPHAIGPGISFALILLGVGVGGFSRYRWALLFSGLLVGSGWGTLQVAWQQSDYLANGWYQQQVIIRGYVTGLPRQQLHWVRFHFVADRMCYQGRCVSGKRNLLLSWYGGVPKIQPGQWWRLRIKLKQPHGFANPGGFDREKWLWQQGIVGTGSVRQGQLLKIHSNEAWIDQWRYALGQQLRQYLSQGATQGIILALVLGDRSGIQGSQWRLLRQTGTSHLVAISGLHIGLVAGFLFFIGRWIIRLVPRLLLYVQANQFAAICGILGALTYSALAGFAISTQRALIMITVGMVSALLKRRIFSSNSLLIALFFVLLWQPFAVLSPGFWLSFTAVGVIIYGVSYRVGKDSNLKTLLRTQWVVFIGLLPLSLWYFQQYSPLSLLANLVAIPWASFVMVPLSLLGTLLLGLPSLAHGLLVAAQWATGVLLLLLQAMQPWNPVLHLGLNNPLLFVALLVMSVLLLAPKGFPGKVLAAVWLLPLLLHPRLVPPMGELWFTVLDVGQGLAAVLQTRHHILIYDTGPKFATGFNAGDAILIPYLRQQGIHRLDTVIISHGDWDHAGGLAALSKQMTIHHILTSAPRIQRQYPVSQFCHAGQHWQWDNIGFKVLYPEPNDSYQKNNSSCVLQVTVGKYHVLLPGDIEVVAEKQLVFKYKSDLRADILLAPHHGSKSSSSGPFIAAVQPHYVIYPVGWHNRYGFPSPIIRLKYKTLGALGLQTAQTGAIRIIINQQAGLRNLLFYRSQYQHFWNSH